MIQEMECYHARLQRTRNENITLRKRDGVKRLRSRVFTWFSESTRFV